MPNTPVAVRVPITCLRCRKPGRIRMQTVLKGDRIDLQWHCSSCDHEWAVTRKEEVPRPA